jgi:hypothetical protein
VKATGDHEEILPRDGDWSCGRNLVGGRRTKRKRHKSR